jgi:hypothetical protein
VPREVETYQKVNHFQSLNLIRLDLPGQVCQEVSGKKESKSLEIFYGVIKKRGALNIGMVHLS